MGIAPSNLEVSGTPSKPKLDPKIEQENSGPSVEQLTSAAKEMCLSVDTQSLADQVKALPEDYAPREDEDNKETVTKGLEDAIDNQVKEFNNLPNSRYIRNKDYQHDFRTPATIINTSTNLLSNYSDRLDEQRKVDLKNNIHREKQTLLYRIQQYKDYQDIQKAIKDGKDITIPQCLKEATDIIPKIAGVVWSYDGKNQTTSKAFYSESKITDVEKALIAELVKNSAQFTDTEQSKIWVSVVNTDDGKARQISVSDGGSKNQLSDIAFIPSRKITDDRTTPQINQKSGIKTGGGFGLTFVQDIVVYGMKGDVELKSDEKGTTISLNIPTDIDNWKVKSNN